MADTITIHDFHFDGNSPTPGVFNAGVDVALFDGGWNTPDATAGIGAGTPLVSPFSTSWIAAAEG